MTLAMKIQEREEVAVFVDRIATIKKLQGKLSNQEISDALRISIEQYNEILSLLDKYPDKDEWEIAKMILYK